MASTLEVVERGTGRDKFHILAVAIDPMSQQMQIASDSLSLDDEIATIDVEALALTYGVSLEILRKNLQEYAPCIHGNTSQCLNCAEGDRRS